MHMKGDEEKTPPRFRVEFVPLVYFRGRLRSRDSIPDERLGRDRRRVLDSLSFLNLFHLVAPNAFGCAPLPAGLRRRAHGQDARQR
jgi:hypothetical protein